MWEDILDAETSAPRENTNANDQTLRPELHQSTTSAPRALTSSDSPRTLLAGATPLAPPNLGNGGAYRGATPTSSARSRNDVPSSVRALRRSDSVANSGPERSSNPECAPPKPRRRKPIDKRAIPFNLDTRIGWDDIIDDLEAAVRRRPHGKSAVEFRRRIAGVLLAILNSRASTNTLEDLREICEKAFVPLAVLYDTLMGRRMLLDPPDAPPIEFPDDETVDSWAEDDLPTDEEDTDYDFDQDADRDSDDLAAPGAAPDITGGTDDDSQTLRANSVAVARVREAQDCAASAA